MSPKTSSMDENTQKTKKQAIMQEKKQWCAPGVIQVTSGMQINTHAHPNVCQVPPKHAN